MNFASWLRQPTTITGLASLAGVLMGGAAHVAGGDTSVSAFVGAAVFSAVHLVINDNTVAKDVSTIATDMVNRAPGVRIAEDAAQAIIDVGQEIAAAKT